MTKRKWRILFVLPGIDMGKRNCLISHLNEKNTHAVNKKMTCFYFMKILSFFFRIYDWETSTPIGRSLKVFTYVCIIFGYQNYAKSLNQQLKQLKVEIHFSECSCLQSVIINHVAVINIWLKYKCCNCFWPYYISLCYCCLC